MADSKHTMTLYYAKQSRLNVLSNLKQLSIFCIAFNKNFLPVSRDTLLGFLELMSRSCGYAHIQHVISSIKFLHEITDNPFIGDSFEFSVMLRGLKRKLARPTKMALPITPEMLILMYEHVNINVSCELAHWTAFLFALRLLFRKSSIAPVSLGAFNPTTGLCRGKAVLSNGVILVFQNFSKTNQFMATTRTTPLIPGNILSLDPYYHYYKLVTENNVPDNMPAFSYLEKNMVKCVTRKSFTTYLKKLLRLIDVDPDAWSGHSFRRGGASLLYRLGLDPLTIQAVGDWSSDTFLRYLEVNIDRLWAAQHAMATFSLP